MSDGIPIPQRQLLLQKVYVKDASLEVPLAPQIFTRNWVPQLDVQVTTTLQPLNNDQHQVLLQVTVTAKLEQDVAFLVEVRQAGIFLLKGINDAAEKQRVLGAECPGLLFPFARESVADLVQRGGFPAAVAAHRFPRPLRRAPAQRHLAGADAALSRSALAPMRALLLGATGQVGRELRQRLVGEVIAPGRAQLDLSNADAIAACVHDSRADVVLNAAAYTAVDAAESDSAMAQRVNAEAPAAMAKVCAKQGSLLVHYSSDYVFDGTSRTAYDETDETNPTSSYGRSKLAGEQAVRAAGCRHLILRTSWVYAAHGKNFLLTMLRLAREKPELRVVADQVGSPTAASSIADATLSMVRAAVARSGTWNVTNRGQTSWHGFAERIVEQGASLGMCQRVPVRAIGSADYPTPAQRPAFSVLANTRLARDFGLRLPAWEVALDATLAQLRRAQAA